MLSKKGKYAIQACLDLAKQEKGKPVLIAEIAERASIPKKFLEIILLDLRNVGILSSKKGKGGGYYLAREPAKVMLGQIVRLMDGPLAPVACVSQTAYRPCEDCPDPATCGIKMVMKDVRDSIAAILDTTSLEDVVQRSQRGASNAVSHLYEI